MSPRASAETLKSLLSLSPSSPHKEKMRHALFSIAQRTPAILPDALHRLSLKPTVLEDGRRLALVCRIMLSLGRSSVDEALWQTVARSFESLLRNPSLNWHLEDVSTSAKAIGRWGAYNRAQFPHALETFAASRVHAASPEDVVELVGLLCSIPETAQAQNSVVLAALGTRAIRIAPSFTLRQWSELSTEFARVQYSQSELLSEMLQALPPILHNADVTNRSITELFDPVPLLSWWSSSSSQNPFAGLTPMLDASINPEDYARSSPEGLLFQLLQLTTGILSQKRYSTAPERVIVILRALTRLNEAQWLAFTSALDPLLVSIGQCFASWSISRNGLKDAEMLVALVPKYLTCLRTRPAPLLPPKELQTGTSVLCALVRSCDESLVSHASGGGVLVQLVPQLLQSKNEDCISAATALINEAARQDIPLSMLQVIRLLLTIAEHRAFTKTIFSFLSEAFQRTLEEIPLVQLCTALWCLELGLSTMERNQSDTSLTLLLSDVSDTVLRQPHRFTIAPLLSLIRSLTALNDNKPLAESSVLNRLAKHLVRSLSSLTSKAPPVVHSQMDARVALTSLGSLLPEETRTFLTAVITEGFSGDAAERSPSRWMREHDPTNRILPRSELQRQLDGILRAIGFAKPSEAERIQSLASSYTELLLTSAEEFEQEIDMAPPDEIRFLFELFADRSIKQDKSLRDALQHLIQTKSVPKLSAFSTVSILHSAGRIRFAYHPTLKKFMAEMSDEQWSTMDASEIALALAALARLGIRTPSALSKATDRIESLCKDDCDQRDLATMSQALQNLGIHEGPAQAALLARAARQSHSISALSLAMLLGGAQAHRLPWTEGNAVPLLDRLCETQRDLTTEQKESISKSLRRTSLPRHLLTASTAALLME